MKNILKLFPLIAGLSLCMGENLLGTGSQATISVRAMSGKAINLEVPVVDGECRVSDVIAELYAFEGHDPNALNKVMPHYTFLHDTQILSDDEMVSVEEAITYTTQEQVSLLVRRGFGTQITMRGNFKKFSSATIEEEFGVELDSEVKQFTSLQEYLDLLVQSLDSDVTLYSAFVHLKPKAIHILAQCLSEVTTSLGQRFQKLNSSGKEDLHNLFCGLCEKPTSKVSQEDINPIHNQNAWIVLSTT